MKTRLSLLGGLIFLCTSLFAQDFAKQTEIFRENYKREFVKTKNSPLKKDDLKYLQFYNPDSAFRVPATFKRVRNTRSFEMPTYSGVKKTYVEYGTVKFKVAGKKQTLTI